MDNPDIRKILERLESPPPQGRRPVVHRTRPADVALAIASSLPPGPAAVVMMPPVAWGVPSSDGSAERCGVTIGLVDALGVE